jgi:glycosyltransferase 2 family protein
VTQSSSHDSRKDTLKRVAKWGIVILVMVFLGLTIQRAYRDFQLHREQLDVSRMALGWVGLSGVVYAISMFPASLAWLQTLGSFKQAVPVLQGLHAYFLGHLGKYIPGKAMVIIIRVGRLRPLGVELKPTIVSIFVETLTSVATGSILGCGLLLCQSPQPPGWMVWSAWLCIPCAFVFLLPHTFRAVLKVLSKSRVGRMPPAVNAAFTWRLMLRTCAWMLLGWTLHGTASWLVLVGLQPDASLWSLQAWTLCTCAVSLGAVVGFASMIPGGAIVRELTITWLLSSLVTHPVALAAAVMFRLVGLVTELILIGSLSAIASSKSLKRNQSPSS